MSGLWRGQKCQGYGEDRSVRVMERTEVLGLWKGQRCQSYGRDRGVKDTERKEVLGL